MLKIGSSHIVPDDDCHVLNIIKITSTSKHLYFIKTFF